MAMSVLAMATMVAMAVSADFDCNSQNGFGGYGGNPSFSFNQNLATAQTVTFSTCNANTKADTQLTLYDASSNVIGLDDDSCSDPATASILTATNLAQGSYTLDLATNGQYSLYLVSCYDTGSAAVTPAPTTAESTANDYIQVECPPSPSGGNIVHALEFAYPQFYAYNFSFYQSSADPQTVELSTCCNTCSGYLEAELTLWRTSDEQQLGHSYTDGCIADNSNTVLIVDSLARDYYIVQVVGNPVDLFGQFETNGTVAFYVDSCIDPTPEPSSAPVPDPSSSPTVLPSAMPTTDTGATDAPSMAQGNSGTTDLPSNVLAVRTSRNYYIITHCVVLVLVWNLCFK